MSKIIHAKNEAKAAGAASNSGARLAVVCVPTGTVTSQHESNVHVLIAASLMLVDKFCRASVLESLQVKAAAKEEKKAPKKNKTAEQAKKAVKNPFVL